MMTGGEDGCRARPEKKGPARSERADREFDRQAEVREGEHERRRVQEATHRASPAARKGPGGARKVNHLKTPRRLLTAALLLSIAAFGQTLQQAESLWKQRRY